MVRFRVIVALFIASVLVAACGTSTTSPDSSAAGSEAPQIPQAPQQFADLIAATEAADKQYDGVEVSVVVDSIQSGYPFFWLAPAIEKAFDIKIKVIPAPFETFYQSIQNDIVSETGAYDILNYPPRFLGDLASAGNIVDLTEYASQWDPEMDDVYPVYQLYTKFDDTLFALPMDGDRLELYYRKDLFSHADEQAAFEAEYGYPLAAPETWDEYLDVAKFFQRDAGATLAGETLADPFSGIAEITKLPDNFDWFLNRFGSYGGIYFDDQMHPQLDTEAGTSALTNFVESVKYGPSDILNFEYVESFDAFVQGQTAMCIQWTDVAKIAEDPNTSKIVGKTGYAQVPGAEQADGSVVHRSILAYNRVNSISKLAENPEAAYRVMQFMNQPEVSLLFVTEPSAGMDPYRISHYADPSAWVQQWDELPAYIENNKLSLTNGYPELTMPGANRYNESLGTHIAQALAGQESVADALKNTTAEWETITDELGRDAQITHWQAQLSAWKEVGLID
ncbi:MAG: extracellular solute-binding protein [Chloroflexota bacterium]